MSEETIVNNEEEPILDEEETPIDEGPKWYEYEDPEAVNFIGTKFIKPDYDQLAYTAVAGWCNETQKAYITESEDGNYYECVPIPVPTLDELKLYKLNALGRIFEESVKGSFTTTEGYNMQFDISDCEKMNGSITLNKAMGIESDYLVQADDTVIENVPMATMESVLLQMLQHYKSFHMKKQVFRAQINSCETKEELDSINIEF